MRDLLAGAVMFVIASDLIIFTVAGLGSLFHLSIPVQYLAFLAIANVSAWGFALADDGRDLG